MGRRRSWGNGCFLVALTWAYHGCTCASSHAAPEADAASVDAASLPDVGPPTGLPPRACERIFSEGEALACPSRLPDCSLEFCCDLSTECVGGTVRGESSCRSSFGGEGCAQSTSTAGITVRRGDRELAFFEHAYAQHALGFFTYLRLTFTTDGTAEACSTQRLTVSTIEPRPESSEDGGPAYQGTYDVEVLFTDAELERPWQFGRARITIDDSEPFRAGGAVSGSIEMAVDGLTISGTFEAPECESWRSPGF